MCNGLVVVRALPWDVPVGMLLAGAILIGVSVKGDHRILGSVVTSLVAFSLPAVALAPPGGARWIWVLGALRWLDHNRANPMPP
jgi:hypothetical protein